LQKLLPLLLPLLLQGCGHCRLPLLLALQAGWQVPLLLLLLQGPGHCHWPLLLLLLQAGSQVLLQQQELL
jgi:hypothetical protein